MKPIRVREYEALNEGTGLQIRLEKSEESGKEQVVCTLDDAETRFSPDDLKGNNRRLLGLVLDRSEGKLYASSLVGIVPLPGFRDVYLQVLPKMEELDAAAMFATVISHPVVGRRMPFGEVFEILTEEQPVEVEDVPSVYFPMLFLSYLHVLNRLVQRGLHRGYPSREHTLRGRVRGRILVGQTLRTHHARGHRDRLDVRMFSHEEDTLENRILYAALKKTEAALATLLRPDGSVQSLIARPKRVFAERVSLVRIHPADVVRARAARVRPDYRQALRLAAAILRHFGYDPFAEIQDVHTSSIRRVYPFWMDMNELFERYVEVNLRKREIVFNTQDGEIIKDYEVYAGYGQGSGVHTDVGELRPDFVVVSREAGLAMIADAKYKLLYESGGLKEDLQQVALYGRMEPEELVKTYSRGAFSAGYGVCPPYVWILYPAKEGGSPEFFRAFVHMGKIPVKVPVRSG